MEVIIQIEMHAQALTPLSWLLRLRRGARRGRAEGVSVRAFKTEVRSSRLYCIKGCLSSET